MHFPCKVPCFLQTFIAGFPVFETQALNEISTLVFDNNVAEVAGHFGKLVDGILGIIVLEHEVSLLQLCSADIVCTLDPECRRNVPNMK